MPPLRKNKPTMQMIAARVGVSIATVSHVFNRSRFVQPELRKKILDCAEEIGYTKKHSLQYTKHKPGAQIGLIINDIRDSVFYQDVIKVTEAVAGESAYSILVGDSENSPEKEIELIHNFIYQQVHGIILASVHHGSVKIQQILGFQGLPVVLIDRKWPDNVWDFIGIDNFQSSFTLVRMLHEQGFRHIGFLGLLNPASPQCQPSTLTERIAGYQMGMLAMGLAEFNHSSSLDLLGDLRKQILEFCYTKGQPRHQAVICFNAPVLCELLKILKNEGLPPGDFHFVTYDEEPLFEFFPIPLTVIRQPVSEISMSAVQLLLEKIRNPSVVRNSGRQIIHPVEFVATQPWRV